MKNIEAFLQELSELSKKYGLAIYGCGCCGSPIIFDIKSGNDVAERLSYNEKEEKYEVVRV